MDVIGIAITGHRPKDLRAFPRTAIEDAARQMVSRTVQRWGAERLVFHTGAAIGVDLWVANIILSGGLAHHLHPPLTDPAIWLQAGWTVADHDLYRTVYGRSDYVCQTCPVPPPAQYQRRNEHMVDSSRLLVAFWTGKRQGGTWNCIRYALAQDVPVVNALDRFQRIR